MISPSFRVSVDVSTETLGDVTMESLYLFRDRLFADIQASREGVPVNLNDLTIDEFNFAMDRLEDAVADHE